MSVYWKTCCAPISQRWVFAVMGFGAVLTAFTMRICLSLAITEMVVATENSDDEDVVTSTCPSSNSTSTTNSAAGTYDWDESLQGVILSSFFWGYIITHIPGALLAERFGGKWTLGLGILSTSIFTLLTPLAVERGGSTALIILRFCMGLGEGTTFPALNTMTAQWAPPSERSKIGTLVMAGGQIGTVLANALSGLLLQHSSIGWRSVFYVYGSAGLVWFLVFGMVCYNSPDEHPFISDEEKEFLSRAMSHHTHRNVPPAPWKHILSSVPVWALIVAQIGHDWGLYTMITDLPLYMSNVMKFSVQSNGLLTSLPYLAMWAVGLGSSWLADWLINSGKMSMTNVRKLFTTVGSMGPAVFIVAASYAGCDRVMAVLFFTIGMGMMGTYYPGMKVNILDVSPNYSGTLMAITNGLGSLSGIATPYLVGVLTPNQTVNEWRLVFWIVFGIFTVTNVVYLVWASGDVQYWNDPGFLNREKEEKRPTPASRDQNLSNSCNNITN